jgi:prepilin-type processing-associated H-X9-DG protein
MHPRLRSSRFFSALALVALVAFVLSCGKKQSGGGDPVDNPTSSSTETRRPDAKKAPRTDPKEIVWDNLHQLGMAFHNYASTINGNTLLVSGVGKKGAYIADSKTKPMFSWRVALLPFVEQAELYKEFNLDESWDSEHNKKLIPKMPKIYQSTTKQAPPGMTHLQQVIGPQCGMLGRYNIANMPDGTSQTVAVIEVAEPVIWTKPDDLYIPETDVSAPPPKDLKKKFGGLFENGFNVLMWDGSVRWVDARKLSEKTLWNALRPGDGNALGNDWPK